MSNITREDFASAVAAAISSVQHLYRQVDHLIMSLRDMLAEQPNALIPVRGTLGKSGRSQSRLVIRHEYGVLFAPAIIDEDDDGEEEDEELDENVEDADEDVDNTPRKRPPAEIGADQPLLAIRIAMYDPQKPDSFEPQIQYALMSKWAIGKTAWTPDQRFVLARYMLRRVPRALASGASTPKGARLVTNAKIRKAVGGKKSDDRRLSCVLPAGVATVPLYMLDSATGLGNLAEQIKAMWTGAGCSNPRG
jgi:hypothetical protein